MFDFNSDYDPITPTGSDLLAELGLDPHSVRDALADDRARRCCSATSLVNGERHRR